MLKTAQSKQARSHTNVFRHGTWWWQKTCCFMTYYKALTFRNVLELCDLMQWPHQKAHLSGPGLAAQPVGQKRLEGHQTGRGDTMTRSGCIVTASDTKAGCRGGGGLFSKWSLPPGEEDRGGWIECPRLLSTSDQLSARSEGPKSRQRETEHKISGYQGHRRLYYFCG